MTERRIHVNPSHLAQNNSDGGNRPALVLVDAESHTLTAHRIEVWMDNKLVARAVQLSRNQAHVFIEEGARVRVFMTGTDGKEVEQRLDEWARPQTQPGLRPVEPEPPKVEATKRLPSPPPAPASSPPQVSAQIADFNPELARLFFGGLT